MKLKKHQVFLFGWLLVACIAYFCLWHLSQTARDKIRDSQPVTGKVTASSFVPRSNTRSIDLKIPTTLGLTQCHASMTKSDYQANSSRWPNVDVYVSKDYKPPLPLECWTVTDVNDDASQAVGENLLYATYIGFMGGLFFYYLIVRIRFGSPRRSMKDRWAETKQ
jgi:hypothetical protein